MKMQYPKNLVGMRFGSLTVIRRVQGQSNENSLWLCKCSCGRPDCLGEVIVRRGNITRQMNGDITCGVKDNHAYNVARAKLIRGTVQRNSRTGITGVNHSSRYKGKYRARISAYGKRWTRDNLDFDDAVRTRLAWENQVRNMKPERISARAAS